MVQGVIFSMPCTIGLLGADGTLYWALRRRRYGFPATANIRCIKKCAGILRTANKSKLSTKQPVKIRALIVQPENYWGPSPDCRGPPVFTRWTYQISKVMCQPNETEKRRGKGMVAQPSIAQGIRFSIQYFICILAPGYNRGSRIQYILYSSEL